MKKTICRILGILILVPLFAGCNDSDDLSDIFIKKWRLTFITENGKGWYPFPGIDSKAYDAYDPIRGDKYFTISFTGLEADNTIKGTFTGNGSANIEGGWDANGKNNSFSSKITSSTIIDRQDPIIQKIIDALNNNTRSYEGDTNNLFINFDYYISRENKITLRLAFTPAR